MNINDYIVKEIKGLRLKDTVKRTQTVFKNYPITHFHVIENNKLLGSFAESDLQTMEDKELPLSRFTHLLNSFYADENATVLELLSVFADNDANIVPVLDEAKNYIGYYDLCDVLDVFSSSPFMAEESETIVIEKSKKEYSMGEIAQIVEASGGKLLGMYISEKTNDLAQITLKIASQETNEIIQTFRRYGYKIVSNHEDDIYLEDLKNRSDYLQKYLDLGK
jgi:predicted transcriptional regulator